MVRAIGWLIPLVLLLCAPSVAASPPTQVHEDDHCKGQGFLCDEDPVMIAQRLVWEGANFTRNVTAAYYRAFHDATPAYEAGCALEDEQLACWVSLLAGETPPPEPLRCDGDDLVCAMLSMTYHADREIRPLGAFADQFASDTTQFLGAATFGAVACESGLFTAVEPPGATAALECEVGA